MTFAGDHDHNDDDEEEEESNFILPFTISSIQNLSLSTLNFNVVKVLSKKE